MKSFDAQATPLKVGDIICSYKIEYIQEQDDFFITYVASYHNVRWYLDRRVLIKEYMPVEIAMRGQNSMVVPRRPDDEEDFYRGLEAFILEAEKLAQIEHATVIPVWLNFETNGTGVIPVWLSFETNGTGYMVTRHRFGLTTLEDHMCLSFTKPPFGEDARAWFIELLEGLAEVHSSGVVHGNISPKSIVLSRDGTAPALMNFGSVRNTLGKLRHNLPEVLASGYAPVEQYGAKDEEQGPWVDVYALGAVMIYCLTGIAPINAMERQERMANGEQDPLLAHLIPAQKKGTGGVAERNALDPLRVLEKKIEQLPDSLKDAPAKEKLAALQGDIPDSVMEFLKTAEDLAEKSELTKSTYTRLLAEMVLKLGAMESDSLEGPNKRTVEIAPKLFEVISRCVAVPYTERFQDATQVLQVLYDYVPFFLADGQTPFGVWRADSIPSPTPRKKNSWGKWIGWGLFIAVCVLIICTN